MVHPSFCPHLLCELVGTMQFQKYPKFTNFNFSSSFLTVSLSSSLRWTVTRPSSRCFTSSSPPSRRSGSRRPCVNSSVWNRSSRPETDFCSTSSYQRTRRRGRTSRRWDTYTARAAAAAAEQSIVYSFGSACQRSYYKQKAYLFESSLAKTARLIF